MGNKVILYNSLKNEGKFIIEETVKQEGLLHSLNPSSVNCFRIMTFRKDKTSPAKVLSVVLRIGRNGNNMDNLAGGGIVGNVDLVTGKVSDCLYDIYLNKYVVHPDSKMKLSGLQIPEFDKIKSFALMLADKIATVGYIGWDIVYSDGKLTVIEGNDCADHDVYQIAAQRGMLKDFCNIVKGEEYAIL